MVIIDKNKKDEYLLRTQTLPLHSEALQTQHPPPSHSVFLIQYRKDAQLPALALGVEVQNGQHSLGYSPGFQETTRRHILHVTDPVWRFCTTQLYEINAADNAE